ncbi:DMT family transporter [Pararhodobacter zhoushanensis]|uniref:DMT family transporter n=1 Tax=Pararhodobacter zhoushanensis TaxID=2479545 RepID=UPI001C70611B|nr:DMT family transporter [Pararhodobacter zhoushanensis]
MAVTLAPSEVPPKRLRALEIVLALAAGSLLSFMLLCNSSLAAYGTPLFSSLTAHGVGTVVAGLTVAGLWRWRVRPVGRRGRAPLWAYLGGLSGALTVLATSIAANSPLALTGTLALGIAGQVFLALVFDAMGAMGLTRRLPSLRDLAALAAILAGTGLIIAARGMGA